ncbi:hypothetical protein [Streptomyces sp. NBC_01276]|uniref:hypothetical protein n=1 Tax=Streptomyces sp. NBC_01276 TaxID=2903808 RepID=UPI00352CAE48
MRLELLPGGFTLAGEGLNVGKDGGDAGTADYPGTAPFTFTGGTLHRVAVDVSGDPYVDLEREADAMLAREQGRTQKCRPTPTGATVRPRRSRGAGPAPAACRAAGPDCGRFSDRVQRVLHPVSGSQALLFSLYQ